MFLNQLSNLMGFFFVCPVVIGLLSIAALGHTMYHVRIAQEYYDPTQSGERPGRYFGRGAELLGLTGRVTPAHFRALMEGFHPLTSEALVKNAGAKRRDTAIDCVFSPFKSFSVVRGLTGDPLIFDAFTSAFDWSIDRAVDRMAEQTFIRKGAKGRLVEAQPVISGFQHEFSRANDPQCHWHLVVKNIATTEGGETGAMITRPYFRHKMAWGALFRCDLTYALQQRFPEIAFRRGNTGIEIDGIPDELLQRFSSRRRAIEEALAGLEAETAAAKQFACLKTRDPKEIVPPFLEMVEKWRRAARELGFDFASIPKVLRTGQRPTVNADEVLNATFTSAVELLSRRQSHFGYLELLRTTADIATGKGVSGAQVEQHVVDQIKRGRTIVCIGELKGQERFSTPEILVEEKELLEQAESLASRRWGNVTTAKMIVRASISTIGALSQWFGIEQNDVEGNEKRKAVRNLASDENQLLVFDGPVAEERLATIRQVAALYSASGYNVQGIATGPLHAKSMTKQAAIPTVTLPWFLGIAQRDQSWLAGAKHAAKQIVRQAVGWRIGLYPYARTDLLKRNSVLIVDGAERIGTQEMAALLDGCNYYGAKLILCGDREGLPSMNRGVPFRAICDRLRHPSLSLSSLISNRQRDQVEALRAGDAKTVLDGMASNDQLLISPSAEDSVKSLVSAWLERGGSSSPRQHLIVAATQAERLAIHREISDRRRPKDAPNQEILMLPDSSECRVGDRVLGSKSSKRFGVVRGQQGTVAGLSSLLNIVRVAWDDGSVTTVSISKYPHLHMGFAVEPSFIVPTEHIYAMLGTQRDNRQVAASIAAAAEQSLNVYTDKARAGDELKDLARQLSIDRTEDLAIVIQRQNDQEQTQQRGRAD